MNDYGLVSRWRSWAPQLLSVLRIVAAFLFRQVGTAKLFAFPAAVMPGGGTAPITSLFDRRRELMDSWARFATAKPADVVSIRA